MPLASMAARWQQALALRIPPPLVLLLCGLAGWALDWRWPLALLPQPVARLAGLALSLAGGGLALAGVLQFRRAHTTINPLNPSRSSHLVEEGLYARTRNPMYLGMALALAGWGCVLGNPLSWLGVPLFVSWITWLQIKPEEQALRQRFGPYFEQYCQRVRRWL